MPTRRTTKTALVCIAAVGAVCLLAVLVHCLLVRSGGGGAGGPSGSGNTNAGAVHGGAAAAGIGNAPTLVPRDFGVKLLKYDEIVPGVEYARCDLKDPVLIYHVIKGDLTRGELRLGVIKPGPSATGSKQEITNMVNDAIADLEEPVAAINGDYYAFGVEGPWGIHLQEGNLLYSPTGKSALLVDSNRVPIISIPTSGMAVQFGPDQEWHEVIDMNRPSSVKALPGFHFFGFTKEFTDVSSLDGGVILDVAPPSVLGLVTGKIVGVLSKDQNAALPDRGLVLVYNGPDKNLPDRVFKTGAGVRIRTSVFPAAVEAIGGGPRIVKDGKPALDFSAETFSDGHADYLRGRHPRSATGISQDRKTVFMLVVVGRRETSKGVSLDDLARLMVELGAWDAMMFDGGGSAVMYTKKHILVNKSKGRSLCNALAIFATR